MHSKGFLSSGMSDRSGTWLPCTQFSKEGGAKNKNNRTLVLSGLTNALSTWLRGPNNKATEFSFTRLIVSLKLK